MQSMSARVAKNSIGEFIDTACPERVNEFATPGCLHSMSERQVLCWFGIPSVWAS